MSEPLQDNVAPRAVEAQTSNLPHPSDDIFTTRLRDLWTVPENILSGPWNAWIKSRFDKIASRAEHADVTYTAREVYSVGKHYSDFDSNLHPDGYYILPLLPYSHTEGMNLDSQVFEIGRDLARTILKFPGLCELKESEASRAVFALDLGYVDSKDLFGKTEYPSTINNPIDSEEFRKQTEKTMHVIQTVPTRVVVLLLDRQCISIKLFRSIFDYLRGSGPENPGPEFTHLLEFQQRCQTEATIEEDKPPYRTGTRKRFSFYGEGLWLFRSNTIYLDCVSLWFIVISTDPSAQRYGPSNDRVIPPKRRHLVQLVIRECLLLLEELRGYQQVVEEQIKRFLSEDRFEDVTLAVRAFLFENPKRREIISKIRFFDALAIALLRARAPSVDQSIYNHLYGVTRVLE